MYTFGPARPGCSTVGIARSYTVSNLISCLISCLLAQVCFSCHVSCLIACLLAQVLFLISHWWFLITKQHLSFHICQFPFAI